MLKNSIRAKSWAILTTLTILSLTGCMAGHTTFFFPENGTTQCEDIYFSASQLIIEYDHLFYYVIPLMVDTANKLKDNIKVRLFIRSGLGVIEISPNDVYLMDTINDVKYRPLKIKEAQNFFSNKEHYLHYEVEFDIKNNSLDYFDIVFEKPLKGCKIPPIHYKKQIEERIW